MCIVNILGKYKRILVKLIQLKKQLLIIDKNPTVNDGDNQREVAFTKCSILSIFRSAGIQFVVIRITAAWIVRNK